jgi:hypothetical protein
MATRRNNRHPVRYYDDDGIPHDGVAVERNGNLTWVEDAETGKGDWLAPHEMDR